MIRRHALMVLLLAAAGCGGDQWVEGRPKTVSAKGTLTLNGAPVDGATIVLSPAEAALGQGTSASALTASDGSFSLSAFPPNDGAVPGKYFASVTKKENPPVQAPAAGSHDEKAPPPPKDLLPKKFSDAKTSGLVVEIPPDGKTDIKIELK